MISNKKALRFSLDFARPLRENVLAWYCHHDVSLKNGDCSYERGKTPHSAYRELIFSQLYQRRIEILTATNFKYIYFAFPTVLILEIVLSEKLKMFISFYVELVDYF